MSLIDSTHPKYCLSLQGPLNLARRQVSLSVNVILGTTGPQSPRGRVREGAADQLPKKIYSAEPRIGVWYSSYRQDCSLVLVKANLPFGLFVHKTRPFRCG